jgi:hypothetical protein
MPLKFGKKEVKLPKEAILASRPLRNPGIKYTEKNGEVHLTIERRKTLGAALLSKIFIMPEKRVLVLDSIGSEVWLLCDGKNKVADIIKRFTAKHRISAYEAELSLLEFFKMLTKRGLLGLEVSKKYLVKRG